jgi:hypothetical protein
MVMDKEEILNNLKNLEFDEAISFQMHSRMFEILGYLSNISEEYLPTEEQEYLARIRELGKDLLNEMHVILDFYKTQQVHLKKNKYQ